MAVVKDPDNQLAQIFTRLVEEHQHKLLRISYMYLKDRTLAEDAVQETFIKVYNALPHFRGECSEKTWITRILINTWNVICQGRIYPILKFLSHNTHIFIKIAKETVVCCLFCRIGYEQSFRYGFVLIRWLSLFSEGSPQIIVLTYMISKNLFVSHHTMGIVRFRSHDCYTVDLSNYQYLKCYLA